MLQLFSRSPNGFPLPYDPSRRSDLRVVHIDEAAGSLTKKENRRKASRGWLEVNLYSHVVTKLTLVRILCLDVMRLSTPSPSDRKTTIKSFPTEV